MSADGTLPPDVLHLYFSNDNKYVDCDTDNVIYEHLRLLSVMPPTHWSAVEALYLQELPDRSSSSTSSTLTYTTFASALLNSLARAERHWEDVLKQPFKLELSTLVLHGHDSPPLLGNPRSLSARYFQHAMATIAAGLSAPVNSLVLIDLTTSLTTLKMLASSCSMLQLWNVRMERKGPRALTRHATDITTSRVIEQPCLTRLWLDEDSLATFFMALAPPCNNLRTLRLTVGENASEIFNQDLQGILDEAAETLEELHYEPYWTKYGPNEDNAEEMGVSEYFKSFFEFSHLKRLRSVELVLPSCGSGRFSRIAVWMSPQGGNLAQRLVQNAQMDGFDSHQCPTDEEGRLVYGIRLLAFRGETDEITPQGFSMQDIDILPHEMNLDIKIDGHDEIGFFDLLADRPFRRTTDEEKRIARMSRRCLVQGSGSTSLTVAS